MGLGSVNNGFDFLDIIPVFGVFFGLRHCIQIIQVCIQSKWIFSTYLIQWNYGLSSL